MSRKRNFLKPSNELDAFIIAMVAVGILFGLIKNNEPIKDKVNELNLLYIILKKKISEIKIVKKVKKCLS